MENESEVQVTATEQKLVYDSPVAQALQEKVVKSIEKQQKEKKDEAPTYQISAVAPKRIWADCSAKDFNSFRDRARAEGFRTPDGRTDLAAIMRALVEGYAHGNVDLPCNHKQKKNKPENQYLKDHQK